MSLPLDSDKLNHYDLKNCLEAIWLIWITSYIYYTHDIISSISITITIIITITTTTTIIY